MTSQKTVLDSETKEIFTSKDDDFLLKTSEILFGWSSKDSLTLEDLVLSPITDMGEITARLDTIEFFMNNEKASKQLTDLSLLLGNYFPLPKTAIHKESGTYSPQGMKVISSILVGSYNNEHGWEEHSTSENFQNGPPRIRQFYNEYHNLLTYSDQLGKTIVQALIEKAKEVFDSEAYDRPNKKIESLEGRKRILNKYLQESQNLFSPKYKIFSPKIIRARKYISKIEEAIAKLEQERDAALLEYCNSSLPENLVNQFIRLYNEVGAKLVDMRVYNDHAKTAKTCSFVRPEIAPREENCLIIRQGAYGGRIYIPIQDFIGKNKGNSPAQDEDNRKYSLARLRQLVPNDLYLDNRVRVEVKEGPNAAGKTFGIKSEMYIAIRALSGNFVPAEYARVSIRDRIILRAKGQGIGISALEQDVNNTNSVVPPAGQYWLIGLDETWLSTEEEGGVSLLAGTIDTIAEQGSSLLLISNHFPQLYQKLKSNPAVKFCHYPFTVNDMGGIEFLRTKQLSPLQSFDYGIKVAETIFGRTHPVISYARQRLKERINPIDFSELKKQ